MSTTLTTSAEVGTRPPLPSLSPQAELAVLARALWREGYDDHIAGHITYRQPDGTFLVNGFGYDWSELRASDVVRIDAEGRPVGDDQGPVTPAITLHVEFHHARPDTGVIVHHHPRFATLWAAKRQLPPAYDARSAFVPDDGVAIHEEFDGSVDGVECARQNVAAIGNADYSLLANHGVLIAAPDVRRAHFRALSLEWRCRVAWEVELAGGGHSMAATGRASQQAMLDRLGGATPFLWEWAVRRELTADPAVLH